MAISKFAVACVAAILAGGATAGMSVESSTAARPAQVTEAGRVTPISAIADPSLHFKDVAVQFASGKPLGHVVAVTTDGAGRASRIRVALDDMPSQELWFDKTDLAYSRAHDVIIAYDAHPPSMTVADAR